MSIDPQTLKTEEEKYNLNGVIAIIEKDGDCPNCHKKGQLKVRNNITKCMACDREMRY